MFFSKIIRPNCKKSADGTKLTFTAIKPTLGDYFIFLFLFSFSVFFTFQSLGLSKEFPFAAGGQKIGYLFFIILFYFFLFFSLIDDQFDVLIDKKNNFVQVKKLKCSRVKWIRRTVADELINAEVVECCERKFKSYRFVINILSI